MHILKYVEHLLILVSTVTGSISISEFASLIAIPIDITIFTVSISTCALKSLQESKSISQL